MLFFIRVLLGLAVLTASGGKNGQTVSHVRVEFQFSRFRVSAYEREAKLLQLM